jgi:hypothetical protein
MHTTDIAKYRLWQLIHHRTAHESLPPFLSASSCSVQFKTGTPRLQPPSQAVTVKCHHPPHAADSRTQEQVAHFSILLSYFTSPPSSSSHVPPPQAYLLSPRECKDGYSIFHALASRLDLFTQRTNYNAGGRKDVVSNQPPAPSRGTGKQASKQASNTHREPKCI